jgi:hypothetical protein
MLYMCCRLIWRATVVVVVVVIVAVAVVVVVVKGKAIALHPWTGPEGSRRLRLPDFKTIGTGWW